MLEELFQSYLITSLAGTVLTLVLTLLKPVTRKKFSYSWQYYIWLGVLVVLLLPIRLTLPEKEITAAVISFDAPAQDSGFTEQDILQNTQNGITGTTPDHTQTGSDNASPIKNHNKPISSQTRPSGGLIPAHLRPTLWSTVKYSAEKLWNAIDAASPFFCTLWISGILATLFCTMYSYRRLIHTITTDSCRISCPELKSFTEKTVIVYKCPAVSSPFLLGLFRPALVLPDIVLTAEQLDNILRHEMTHLNRRDLWYKWLAVLVRCLHWFNPAVYYIVKQINTECEISCDLSVVKHMSREEELCYINTILSLLTPKTPALLLTTGMTGSKKTLQRRFTMIKNKKNTTRLMITASILTALLLLLMTLLASGVLSDAAKQKTPVPSTTPVPTTAATFTPSPVPTHLPEQSSPVPGTSLTEEELHFFNEIFFTVNEQYPGKAVRNNILSEEFDTPTQVNLFFMLYDEPGEPVSEDEILKIYEEIPDSTPYKLPSSYINELLQYYLGITLQELPLDSLNHLIYSEATDCYYGVHSDAMFTKIQVEHGTHHENGIITLLYRRTSRSLDTLSATELAGLAQYEATLQKTETGYRFLKNKLINPTPPSVPVLQEEVIYSRELIIEDSIELLQMTGKGWLADLNLDGTPERLYYGEDGIYINEQWVLGGLEPAYREKAFWLLDIDKNDSYIELMIYRDMGYELYCYTPEGVLICTDECACGMYGSTSGSFEAATDIRRPIRIDSQTIAFQTANMYFDYYVMTLSYRLNENHKLEVVPQEYELPEHRPIAFVYTDKPLKLYESRSFDSSYKEITEPTFFYVEKIDGVEWVFLNTKTGYGYGWIHVKDWLINKELDKDVFIGYANVP